MSDPGTWNGCYARLTGNDLVVGNTHVERCWRLGNGRLYAVSLTDKATGRDWLAGEAAHPSFTPPTGIGQHGGDVHPRLEVTVDESSAVSEPSLLATLHSGDLTHRIRVFPGAPSITAQLIMPMRRPERRDGAATADTAQPSGVEATPHPVSAGGPADDVVESLTLRAGHHRLTRVALHDQTDVHANLAFEKTYYLERAEPRIALRGNLFFIEDVLTKDGIILLKHAPLPDARPVQAEIDLELRDTDALTLHGHGTADGGEGYPCAIIAYRGGRNGRIAALHAHQRQYRPFKPGRDGLFQSNTWGDRSRDARVTDEFVRAEIAAGAELGVDVVQIDDGWQSGKTSNSADPVGGVWSNYWETSRTFWQPHPERFPAGLKPLADAANMAGVKLGLWFSPDSSNDFAHADDDANTLLTFHMDLGVNDFKIDGVKATTKAGERNLMRMFDMVLEESSGEVAFDLDVTAQVRPGYFGAMHVGPIFVENRYTDWHRYHPHHTLRTLWTLSQYMDPVRLRMEFLNHARNTEKYGDDPLQPARYRPDCLFATVMFSSPLGWFEVSNLPESYVREAGPLIETWKDHRDAIFAGQILPIGELPDGANWTGFVSLGDKSTHLLLFRGINQEAERSFDLAGLPITGQTVRRLGGDGEVRVEGTRATAGGIEPLRFGWFELT